MSALARAYGVSYMSVKRVVDQATADRMARASKELYAAACDDCGKRCIAATHPAKRRHAAADGLNLCHSCRSVRSRTSVRLDQTGAVIEVYCSTCRTWLPPEAFGRGRRFPELRDGGFHNACRACNTRLRRAYRERHRVPCEGCGKPIEGKGRANSKTDPGAPGGRRTADPDRPFLCLACWHKSPEGLAAKASGIAAIRTEAA